VSSSLVRITRKISRQLFLMRFLRSF
jgi:hypothetical protein